MNGQTVRSVLVAQTLLGIRAPSEYPKPSQTRQVPLGESRWFTADGKVLVTPPQPSDHKHVMVSRMQVLPLPQVPETPIPESPTPMSPATPRCHALPQPMSPATPTTPRDSGSLAFTFASSRRSGHSDRTFENSQKTAEHSVHASLLPENRMEMEVMKKLQEQHLSADHTDYSSDDMSQSDEDKENITTAPASTGTGSAYPHQHQHQRHNQQQRLYATRAREMPPLELVEKNRSFIREMIAFKPEPHGERILHIALQGQ